MLMKLSKSATTLNPVLAAAGMLAILFSNAAVAQYAKPPEEDKPSSAVAESWLGRPASELLVQWPVDRGFTQEENDETGETLYTYHFGRNAYSYDEAITENRQIGEQRTSSVTYPIYGNVVVGYNRINVPYQHHCTITFGANEAGVIHRYVYTGIACRRHVKHWGRPKATKGK
jgi:hypothetical protein